MPGGNNKWNKIIKKNLINNFKKMPSINKLFKPIKILNFWNNKN